MDILKIAGLALLGAFVTLLLKQGKGEYSTIIGLTMALLVSGYMIVNMLDVVSTMERLWVSITGDKEFLQILMKIIGITYITDLTSGICKECGNGVLAGQVSIAGKIGVLLSGFPIFMNIIDFILKLES